MECIYDAYNEVACLILGSMTPELHRQFENSSPYDMIKELKSMFEKQAEIKGYVEQLERLGYVLPQDISVGLILNGLTSDFDGFVRICNMHNMGKTVGELHALLIEYDKGLPKKAATPQLMAIQCGRIKKANKKSQNAKGTGKEKGKGKDKSYIPKPKNPKPSTKERPAKDDACHHCKEVGHWKRNYPVYLDKLIMKKKQVSLLVLQDLRGERKLKQGALYFYIGNGVCAQVEAIGSYDLFLPNGLVICLDNCHYAKLEVLFQFYVCNGIFEIDMINRVPNVNSIYTVSNKRTKHNLDSTYLWHFRLAHISKKRIEKLQHDGLLKLTYEESFDKHVSCLSGKMTRKPFPHHTKRATDLLGIIHTDVCGPLRHVSRQGASYFITFTDDYSRYGYVYLLKHKHELFETFKLTPLYTPQHNGVSERRNRTLLDMVRSMMSLITLSLSFWDYALKTIARILNMVPTKKVYKTPYKLWYGKVPNLSYLKVWGCKALMKRDTPDKLQQRSVKCIFIGYPKEMTGYYFYFPPKNKIVVARYAEFLEKNLLSQEISRRAEELEEIQDEDTSPFENTSEIPMEVEGFEPPQEEVVPIRRSARTHRAPDRLCLNVEVVDAMNAEMQSMKDNQVWRLVDLPPNCKTVRNKWIFKKKTDMDGNVHTYKARLVAKAFTQTYGVDYEETFSPVADIRAIRILIAIVAFYDYEIWKMDVKSAFLNGYLDEDIYMVQPEGFVDPNHHRKVCKLQRSIYGLKQTSRSWNKRFDEEIKRFGFTQNLDEPCVYQKASGSNCFAMKDFREAAFILGIKIYRDRSKRLIRLSQSAYMDKILKRYRMDNSKRGYIPMQEKLDLNKTQGASTLEEVKSMHNVPYASVVGSIMYATAVKTILKYLRNTKDMFLVYGGNPEAELRVDCYCDDGFETDRDDTKSQTASLEAGMEVFWIRKFTSGLGIVPTINEPIKMFCDNSAALHFANKPGVQKGAIYYHKRYHYVRECIELGKIKLLKVHTDDNLADPFTKALSKRKLTQHVRSMGLHLASSFM
ncbi:putative RNA-directed DNA polymerase [Tanacetum coccineum]